MKLMQEADEEKEEVTSENLLANVDTALPIDTGVSALRQIGSESSNQETDSLEMRFMRCQWYGRGQVK